MRECVYVSHEWQSIETIVMFRKSLLKILNSIELIEKRWETIESVLSERSDEPLLTASLIHTLLPG